MRLHVQNILPSNHFLHSCCAPQAEGAAGHLNLLYCDRLDARISLLFYSHIFCRCSFGAFTRWLRDTGASDTPIGRRLRRPRCSGKDSSEGNVVLFQSVKVLRTLKLATMARPRKSLHRRQLILLVYDRVSMDNADNAGCNPQK